MPSKIREKAERLAWLLRNGRLPQAVGFASQFVLGRSLYTDHLATYFASDQLPVMVEGNVMYLSTDDPGISTELLHFGTRERAATAIMRRAFGRLKETTDNPLVIDIGAHRGYYTFQAASILADSGTVHAVEPDPANFEALRRGIEANGFENVHAERCAIGGADTTESLKVARSSNSHTLRSVSASESERYTGETVETDVYRVDTYLDTHGIEPADVDIVKIDVEGYEALVFEGMERLLEADSKLLVFVELHPHRVEPGKLRSIVEAIDAAGLRLVHASSSAERTLDDYDAVKRHLAVREGRHSVDLIARRPRATSATEASGRNEASAPEDARSDVRRPRSPGEDD